MAFQLSVKATMILLLCWIVASVIVGLAVGRFLRFGGRFDD